VMNAAARVVSDTEKFACALKTILHDELHWLEDVTERIEYKLGGGVTVYGVCTDGLIWLQKHDDDEVKSRT